MWKYWDTDLLNIYINEFKCSLENVKITNSIKEYKSVMTLASKAGKLNVSIKGLPGQCWVMIAYDFEYRREKAADLTLMIEVICLLEYLAKRGGYTKLMVSQISDGTYYELFIKSGFQDIKSFLNKRSGNNVSMLLKDV